MSSAGDVADFVIRRGRVVDGTGKPEFVADVAIKDGIITGVGCDLPVRGMQEFLGCLLVGCLDFDFSGLYGLCDSVATSSTFWRCSEVSPGLMPEGSWSHRAGLMRTRISMLSGLGILT